MKTQAAMVANAIKTELKQEFPKIKFRVKSSNFAGGNSVDVRYVNGPAYNKVATIAEKFVSGHFDGMTDSYVYRKNRLEISAKFISVDREISPAVLEKMKSAVLAYYNSDYTPSGYELDRIVWDALSDTEIPEGENFNVEFDLDKNMFICR